MLGWGITIYTQPDGKLPATSSSPDKDIIVRWDARLFGLDWLDEMVKAGEAVGLGGNGYPLRFTAKAKNLIPKVSESLPAMRVVDIKFDKAVVDKCDPEEWLLVEAWDLS
jgi:hypothetical protein